jgi:uncharacterized protein (DUF736 family)
MSNETQQTIVLFPNKDKKTSSHPDFNGKIQEGDVTIKELALWWNESKTGVKYLKGKINEPRERKETK